MRLLWATDLHLNHAGLAAWDDWLSKVHDAAPDALVITGDISEGEDVFFQLQRVVETLDFDVYFVLGNHDFYSASIAATRQNAKLAARDSRSLCYLSESPPIELSVDCYLLGVDGWGDATVGDYENSTVRLNDFLLIKDFRRVDPISWPRLLNDEGNDSAQRLMSKLAQLPEHCRRVVIATHVPPFREACWYQGKTTDDNWAPFFVCGQVGDVLRRFANSNPQIEFTVLCGHTHHKGEAELANNLRVLTGAAEYGAPSVECVLDC
ncbi:MAG: metallophosphoesterase [Planctomycetota bacterium]